MKSLLIFNFQSQPPDKAQRTNCHHRTKYKCGEFDIVKVTMQEAEPGAELKSAPGFSCLKVGCENTHPTWDKFDPSL